MLGLGRFKRSNHQAVGLQVGYSSLSKGGGEFLSQLNDFAFYQANEFSSLLSRRWRIRRTVVASSNRRKSKRVD
jgi:hypothetical protein